MRMPDILCYEALRESYVWLTRRLAANESHATVAHKNVDQSEEV